MPGAFMSVSKSVVACVLGLAMTTGGAALAQTGDDPALKNMNACLSGTSPSSEAAFMTNLNPALNDPDRVAWCLFLYVNTNAATSGNNNALFETWASDNDTFQTNPVWPGPGSDAKPLRRPPSPEFETAGAGRLDALRAALLVDAVSAGTAVRGRRGPSQQADLRFHQGQQAVHARRAACLHQGDHVPIRLDRGESELGPSESACPVPRRQREPFESEP